MANSNVESRALHTIQRFWNKKRVLKLTVFALIMGNLTLYCVGVLAKRQVLLLSSNQHSKIYTAYLQAVEKSKKESSNTKSDEEGSAPFWEALNDVRKQFPFTKVNVVLQETVDSEKDKKTLDVLKSRPKGWSLTEEVEGWSKSFYVLPTKNLSALQVTTFIKDDLEAWHSMAVTMGGYAFVLLFVFGWFWSRGMDDALIEAQQNAGISLPGVQEPNVSKNKEVAEKIAAITVTISEMGRVTAEICAQLEAVEKHSSSNSTSSEHGKINKDYEKYVDEMLAQIRLLAVNGSIEASRSVDAYRTFHVILQEINQLATQTRDVFRDHKIEFGGSGPIKDSVDFSGVKYKLEQLQSLFEKAI